jgi:hypothetical protein
MKGLDFIVGGIPRGGTTAFADALNQHPDIFCYAAETSLLPFAQEIGGHGPVPAGSVPAVRSLLQGMLRQNLVEMVEFNLALGSPDLLVRFSPADINHIAAEITRGIDPRGDARPLIDIASATLAGELRQRSGRAVVGEKTPTNITALAADGRPATGDGGPAVFAIVRRPFAVIRSMRARLANNADHFASAFRGDTAQQAGFFVRFALACARMAGRGAHLHRYESFAGNPRDVLPGVLAAIGVPATGRSIDAIARQIDFRTRANDRAWFSHADQAIIDAITEPALAALGYARDPRSRAAEVALQPGWRVLSGQFDDRMLAPRVVVLLVAEPQHRRATLRFWHMFPGTVADASDTVRWTVDAADGRPLGAGAMQGGGPATVNVAIDLEPDRGVRCANGHIMHVVEAACSHGFVPLVHPFRTMPPSSDQREISGQLVAVDFS